VKPEAMPWPIFPEKAAMSRPILPKKAPMLRPTFFAPVTKPEGLCTEGRSTFGVVVSGTPPVVVGGDLVPALQSYLRGGPTGVVYVGDVD